VAGFSGGGTQRGGEIKILAVGDGRDRCRLDKTTSQGEGVKRTKFKGTQKGRGGKLSKSNTCSKEKGERRTVGYRRKCGGGGQGRIDRAFKPSTSL